MRLRILHFNDLHGRLEQVPRLMSLIQQERAAARAEGRQLLILDAGDSSDRACWESDITQGRANFALLEAMGVQASVVGNGEALQWGRGALARIVAAVHFPVLAANLADGQDHERPGVPGLLASTLFDLDGLRVGVLGLTAVFGSGYARFGLAALDPLPVLRREVERLRAQGAQTLILLSHLGCMLDPARKRADIFGDEDVPAACPEIDVIVGGHTHTEINPPVRLGNTVLAQAGDYGRWLGRLDLDLDDAGRVRAFDGRLIPCGTDLPSDPSLLALLELVREEAGRLLDAPVGSVAQDLPHTWEAASPFATRVADALRELCQADLAVFFSGLARSGLAAGPLTRRDLCRALPGASHVTAAQVSGAQVRRMLERMLASPFRSQSINPQRDEPPLGLPACSSNVTWTFDEARPPDERVLDVRVNGAPLDPGGRYRLASTYLTLSDITDDPEYDYIGLESDQAVELIRVEEVLWQIFEGWARLHSPIQ